MYEAVEVVNRRNRCDEYQFDGKVIKFGPIEKKHLPEVMARNIVGNTALQMDMATGVRSAYSLGITGDPAWPTSPLPGELAEENPTELLDRSSQEQMRDHEPHVVKDGEATPVGTGKKEDPGKFVAEGDGGGRAGWISDGRIWRKYDV